MDTIPEVTFETIDTMICVNEGVKFLEKYAPYDWRKRLAKAIFTGSLYLLDSRHDVMGFCFRGTVYKKSLAYGRRAHSLEESDRKNSKVFQTSTDVKHFFGRHMCDETRTSFQWEDLGLEVRSSDKKEQDILTWAWRRRLEPELRKLRREKAELSQ